MAHGPWTMSRDVPWCANIHRGSIGWHVDACIICNKTTWWFQIFVMFTPTWGRFPLLTSICFRWVGSTTNPRRWRITGFRIPGDHRFGATCNWWSWATQSGRTVIGWLKGKFTPMVPTIHLNKRSTFWNLPFKMMIWWKSMVRVRRWIVLLVSNSVFFLFPYHFSFTCHIPACSNNTASRLEHRSCATFEPHRQNQSFDQG